MDIPTIFSDLYYEAPPKTVFKEMQRLVWARFKEITKDEPRNVCAGYLKEKRERIFSTKNINDDFMYLFSLLDIHGQRWVLQRCSVRCAAELLLRLFGANTSILMWLIGTIDIKGYIVSHYNKVGLILPKKVKDLLDLSDASLAAIQYDAIMDQSK